MANDPQPSFSTARRWRIGFDLAARTVLVLAVAGMVNFIGTKFFHRFYLSSLTRIQLASRTVSVLHSLTNQVTVTLYYDRGDDYYPEIVALLKQYNDVNPNLTFRTVDPVRPGDAGAAAKVKAQYGLNTTGDKNLIIFDAGDKRVKIFPGDALVPTKLEQIAPDDPRQQKLEFWKRPLGFNGEIAFTSTLIALENTRPFKAYYLRGNGEPALDDSDKFGYLKFARALDQNYITVTNLELGANQDVPADCDLLIYIAPGVEAAPLPETEREKISQYLAQGGRLLALLNFTTIQYPTGLEPILQRWGVNVVADYVKDPEHTITGQDIRVTKFGQHPIVDPIAGNGLSLQLIMPRPVARLNAVNQSGDAPQVTELAFSSDNSVLEVNSATPPRRYPLIAAVEQKNTVGVATTHGAARIVVAGDSIFLANYWIDGGANRDFLGYAANWLLDRPQLLEGIQPRPVTEYRLEMTDRQQREIHWLLLGALPGAVLLFGGLVWLARRK